MNEKLNSKIEHALDNLEHFVDIVSRYSTNFQKLLNAAKPVQFNLLKYCRYTKKKKTCQKKWYLLMQKIQTYLSNPKWLLFIYNLGGRHLNMELNLISAYKIHFN